MSYNMDEHITRIIRTAKKLGFCAPEWEKEAAAVDWYVANGGGNLGTIERIDKSLPYGPTNTVILSFEKDKHIPRLHEREWCLRWDRTRTLLRERLEHAKPVEINKLLRMLGKTEY